MAFQKGHKPWNKGKSIQVNTGRTHFKKGSIPWNKGKSWDKKTKDKISKSKRGVKVWGGKREMPWMQGSRHPLWKGGKPKCLECGTKLGGYSTKNKKCWKCFRKNQVSINAPNWKGDDVGYTSLHAWVKRYLGKAQEKECVHCGSKKYLQWANVSRKYNRKLNDWIPLCAKCHSEYDDIAIKTRATRLGLKYEGKVPKLLEKFSHR